MMMKSVRVAVAVLGIQAVGCGGSSTTQVKGRVTDGAGTQGQSLGVRAMQQGGSGTVAATTKVRASSVGQGGMLTTVAEANIQAQGSYTLEVPAGEERLVLQALDASGQVVASTLLDAAGEADQTTAPPMDGESSLEAGVFAQMVADGASAQSVNTVDVRARINTQMAEAARQGSSTGDAFRARVKALAEATRAAQQAQVEMYARAGVQTSQERLFQGELAASAALNAALDSGADAAAAYEAFLSGLSTAAEQQGAKAEQQAQGERAAGAAFRATLEARLSTQDAQPLVDAAARGSATLEARTSGAALQALVSGASAVDAATQRAAAAATRLKTQVSASTTAEATAQAFATYQANVATGADLQATVLGGYLQVSSTNQLALSLAVQASVTAAATLDAALDAAASAAITSNGTNVTLLATRTAEAYQAYATAVRAQTPALSAVFGTKASASVEVLIVAGGSFQSSP
ncbi:MAG: hypothetical protein ABW123_21815 [Cystobacter sp.]